ncbi:dNTP triphosphohydrolase [Prevotella sp. E13-17]|uniref:dGTP triphosphohydrolase n=1 Tax=Prevotella sp. E13-17 TaxID=2913616 RepID=UPI001EDB01AE|nr:dNTP triphosphohydrolase [Prevotella sp. E13-17]UKK51211.1 dNTP triphosphohydrolase [Prevotella sp. E13-17]
MNWEKLISNCRLGQEHRHLERHDDRTEFKRDYDRLIFSAPFRRLQNKTQVFPLPGSIFVHNRLTHSLEVASVGMSLGNDVASALLARGEQGTFIGEIGQIVATACLAHDLGNPPFGHSGEKAIQTFFTEGKGAYLQEKVSPEFWSDITRFDGNANAFRLLTHSFKGRRKGGFAMTYSTLASIVKYPYPSCAAKKNKFGFFTPEHDDYVTVAQMLGIPRLTTADGAERWARYPLVYLVEAADDICYEIMDLEDAYKLKILNLAEAKELMLSFFDETGQNHIMKRVEEELLYDPNEQIQYLRACVIGLLEHECYQAFMKHEDEILEGTFQGSLIEHISEVPRQAYIHCAEVSKSRIYRSKPVLDVELSGYRIMATLMELMVEAIEHPDRYYSQQLIGRVSSQYEIEHEDLEVRLMAVIDYISGMTDVYALDVYQKICGISLPII